MSAPTDSPRTLYRLQGCPYCERVVSRLQTYGLEYRSRFVEPMHLRRNAVKRAAGVRSVPVLVDEETGVTMAESANIVDYLDSVYGDGAAGTMGAAEAAGNRGDD
ncbi:glutaredoxin family protein [Natronosalvus rutilus]|uniref:Glutathione S-transferase N-terminal domain-containing protein n=1 Tax=Natronosalvus rutilus TaxID=2953753 RepID=A0A9E7NCU7_9EURY|nr:glutathione S-transferase N-terminal domain-containing protein [Natronosalvus rutilus]UTF54653.1 glutathione S-transferase N-terminal domain-containing protein [Natronosalvus rutilus]